IVHRDLKPENIFLSEAEGESLQPKLVDFGIAKVDMSTRLLRTQGGVLLGSPVYMSPEQARGADVDARTDVWSLSVVLYEIVSGQRPFEGKTSNAILLSIGRHEPRPITELAAGDGDLWAILKKGLEKNPR